MPRCLTPRSGGGFEREAEALALQRVNGSVADALGGAAIVGVGPRVLVGRVASQEVGGGHEDGVREGDPTAVLGLVNIMPLGRPPGGALPLSKE